MEKKVICSVSICCYCFVSLIMSSSIPIKFLFHQKTNKSICMNFRGPNKIVRTLAPRPPTMGQLQILASTLHQQPKENYQYWSELGKETTCTRFSHQPTHSFFKYRIIQDFFHTRQILKRTHTTKSFFFYHKTHHLFHYSKDKFPVIVDPSLLSLPAISS